MLRLLIYFLAFVFSEAQRSLGFYEYSNHLSPEFISWRDNVVGYLFPSRSRLFQPLTDPPIQYNPQASKLRGNNLNDEVCPWKILCPCIQREYCDKLTISFRRKYAIRGSAISSPHIHYIKVRVQRLLSYRPPTKRSELARTILFVNIRLYYVQDSMD